MAVLERFYLAHYDAVVRFVAGLVSEPQDAARVVADVVLAAVDSADAFDHRRGGAVRWLIGIARNTVRHFQRQWRIHGQAVLRLTGWRWLDDDIVDLLQHWTVVG